MELKLSNMKEIRWKQRFSNFEKAFKLLEEGISLTENTSNIVKEGVIKRFEYTFELAWKTLKDYMEHGGIVTNLPREVIKQAFANGLILDGDAWIDMLEKRNLIAHTYDEKNFETVFSLITQKYFQAIKQVYDLLSKKNKET